jgi:hypothetical protein
MSTGRMPYAFSSRTASGRPGVDRLLCGLQDRPASPDSSDDILQVADAPSEAVDAGDHQDVAGGAPRPCGAAMPALHAPDR